MTDNKFHVSDYCAQLVRVRDEDRWLAAQYARDTGRRALIALYAFHSELRRAPSMVSEAPLGEIRLQWWREALDEIRRGATLRAHPVVEALAAYGVLEKIDEDALERIIDANARPLYESAFADVDALADWLAHAEGEIDRWAGRLLGIDDVLMDAVGRAGVAFALAREGAALAGDINDRAQEKAGALWAGARSALRCVEAAGAPAILHLALTPTYLKRSPSERGFGLRKRLRLFYALAFSRF